MELTTEQKDICKAAREIRREGVQGQGKDFDAKEEFESPS
jgi:hypothetical protein